MYRDRMLQDMGLQAPRGGAIRLEVRPVGQTAQMAGEPWSATLDYLVYYAVPGDAQGASWPLEIKTRNQFDAKRWGEDGSANVPEEVHAQVQWQLLVTGYRRADVAVLFGNWDFRIFTIPAKPEYQASLVVLARQFWRHVERGEPPEPDGSDSWEEYLARRFPKVTRCALAATTPDLDRVMQELALAQTQRKAAEQAERAHKERLKLAIRDAAGIEGPAGRALWSEVDAVEGVDWQQVARALASTIFGLDGESPNDLVEEMLQTYSAAHRQVVRKAYRVFNFTSLEVEE
jgi:hypothetical protein